MVNHDCVIETEGYRAIFHLKSLHDSQKILDLVVEFVLNPKLKELSFKSVPAFIFVNDLKRLVSYFENHIESLKQNSSSESDVFLDYGLGFELRASQGDVFSEIESEPEGSFGLLVMVNIGWIEEEISRTYVGGESIVTLENIRNFISSVNQVLTEVSKNKEEPARLIDDIVANCRETWTRKDNGTTAYWDENTATLVIENQTGFSTAFRPAIPYDEYLTIDGFTRD